MNITTKEIEDSLEHAKDVFAESTQSFMELMDLIKANLEEAFSPFESFFEVMEKCQQEITQPVRFELCSDPTLSGPIEEITAAANAMVDMSLADIIRTMNSNVKRFTLPAELDDFIFINPGNIKGDRQC